MHIFYKLCLQATPCLTFCCWQGRWKLNWVLSWHRSDSSSLKQGPIVLCVNITDFAYNKLLTVNMWIFTRVRHKQILLQCLSASITSTGGSTVELAKITNKMDYIGLYYVIRTEIVPSHRGFKILVWLQHLRHWITVILSNNVLRGCCYPLLKGWFSSRKVYSYTVSVSRLSITHFTF